MRASRCLHTCSNALERGSSPSLLPQVIQALRLGFLAFMRIALATRCTDLYLLDGFGPDHTLLPPDQRVLLPHSCSNCHKRIPAYISSDRACWIYDLLTSTVHHCWCCGDLIAKPEKRSGLLITASLERLESLTSASCRSTPVTA